MYIWDEVDVKIELKWNKLSYHDFSLKSKVLILRVRLAVYDIRMCVLVTKRQKIKKKKKFNQKQTKESMRKRGLVLCHIVCNKIEEVSYVIVSTKRSKKGRNDEEKAYEQFWSIMAEFSSSAMDHIGACSR